MSSAADRFHHALLDVDEDHGCGDLPEEACHEVPGNVAKLIGAHTLQHIGDRVVDAKTVLPWLLAAVGAPAGFVGLLVPIRESGSMLPQASLVGWLRRRPLRKWVWVAGGLGQAASVAAMATTAATASGVLAGVLVVGALAAFALSRSFSSIASKDVLGRTVPKGQRGQVNGLSTVTSGAVAITIGVAIRAFGGDEANVGVLATMLAGAAVAWVAAAAVYARVEEQPGTDDDGMDAGWLAHAVDLLTHAASFRRFVLARALLLVSALSPPFVVTLAAERGGVGFGRLGPFLIASGLANLLGGRLAGRLADTSSRRLMMGAAAMASAVLLVLLVLLQVPEIRESALLYPAVYLLLALAHTGVRVGRKTYVVDLAGGNERTDYVAVSNTAMGVLLLVAGAISAGLAQIAVEVALWFLTALGLVGVVVARGLPEVGDGT